MTPKHIEKLLHPHRVTDGKDFRLADYPTNGTPGRRISPQDAAAQLASGVVRLASLQQCLAAQGEHALLVLFQGMDAAGKDSTIRHVMSGVDPQGVTVTSFKSPGPEALAHDYLWRVHQAVPARGQIGIFNRSHYEEVLICRVHPELLDRQRLPAAARPHLWRNRLEDIANFERYLTRQGITLIKIYLHLSPEEQKRRFLARIDEPAKHWKFTAADLSERAHWHAYAMATEAAIAGTASKHAPWYIIPADHKWMAQLLTVEAMVQAMQAMQLQPPTLSAAEQALLQTARAALQAEEPRPV